jgi:soluble lytic murein transglycosylase-like protein
VTRPPLQTSAPILRSPGLAQRLAPKPAAVQQRDFAAVLAKASTNPTALRSLAAQLPTMPAPTTSAGAKLTPTSLRSTPAGSASAASLGEVPYASLIEAAARKAGVDPALVAAVVKAESGFNPQAKSGVGAKGLMQLMDATARGLGVTNSFDPAQNVEGGAKFLGSLLKQFNGDVRLALAGYNAGPGNVQKYGGVPPFEETQQYVPKVLGFYEQFKKAQIV